MNPIDIQLYRPLKKGIEYEKLIPPYKGVDYSFDKKKDNSTTYDTLFFMAQWSNKYADQMSKVALKLKGRTLAETANNVYQFLYNHFQYKIDGEMQNLYSPSAAWHFREKGFDCKTYSILASIILLNLKIPHAFRMVQQSGLQANNWSHVYVVVPNGNNHFVIDATTHNNKEVAYTKKYDHNMEHRGLASPFVKFNGLGCSCQGKSTTKTGLNSPAVLSNTVRNFHTFLNELEKNGISRQVTTKMLELVKFNVEKGIDPNMDEIFRKSLSGSSQIFKGLNGGIDIGETATAVGTGDYVGATIAVVKGIFPVEETFGAVFANGFDLSCWNSSYSEQKAKPDIEKDMPYILEWSNINKELNKINLDRFMFLTQAYINDSINGQQSKFAKCTRKGHALRQAAVENIRKVMFEEIQNKGITLTSMGKKKGIGYPTVSLPGYAAGKVFGWANPDVEFDSYNLVFPKPVQSKQTDENGNTAPDTASKSSSFGVLATVISVAALGAKFLL